MKPSDSTITTHGAKCVIKDALRASELPDLRLSARTVGFDGVRCVVVQVHAWTVDPRWDALERAARAHGFIIQPKGPNAGVDA